MATRPAAAERIAALRCQVNARAAGWWRIEGDQVVLVAFDAAPDMPPEVRAGFVRATSSVPLSRVELGVVRAAVSGSVAVSRLEDSPPDSGSGLWLRRFAASRSVAVPIAGGVVSVALGDTPDDDAVARTIRAAM